MRMALPISPGDVDMVTSREILPSLDGATPVNEKRAPRYIDRREEGRLTKEEFLQEFSKLRAAYVPEGVQPNTPNDGCVECPDCSACIDCVFCRTCVRCYRCRYSNASSDSSLLTHSERCKNSHGLAYSQDCDHCADSNYLTNCAYCFECD